MKSTLSKLLACTVSQLPLMVLILCFSVIPTFFPWQSSLTVESSGGVCSFIFALIYRIFKEEVPQVMFIALLTGWLASWRKWIWWTVFIIWSTVFYGELLCINLQHSRICSSIVMVMMQTNAAETGDYVGSMIPEILKATGIMAIVVAGFLICNKLWEQKATCKILEFLKDKRRIQITMSLFIAICIPLSVYSFVREYKRHPFYWQRMTYSFHSTTAPLVYCFAIDDAFFGPVQKRIDALRENLPYVKTDTTEMKDTLTVVYVIGESYNRNRSSLYGYPLNTSRRMEKYLNDGSLVVLDNVIAQSNKTIDMLFPLLSLTDIESSTEEGNASLLPMIFKQSGYTSGYYDNQSALEDAKNFDYGCNFFFADPDIRAKSIDRYNRKTYDFDGEMIEECPIDTVSARSLTVYHLMGQHVSYFRRYRKEEAFFDKSWYADFKDLTREQRDVTAEYDNALLHTDMVLNKIIGKLGNKCAVMIFTSDHGEEAHDFRNHVGRELSGSHIGVYRVIHEVPALIWMSGRFREKYPDEAEQIRRNRHKALYNTDLPHTIMRLAGLKSDAYRDELSIMNESVSRTDRVILHTFHYDRNREELKKVKMYYSKRRGKSVILPTN